MAAVTEVRLREMYRVLRVPPGEWLTLGDVYECTSIGNQTIGLHRPLTAKVRPGAGTYVRVDHLRNGRLVLEPAMPTAAEFCRSDWLKRAYVELSERDPLDALYDVEQLLSWCAERADAALDSACLDQLLTSVGRFRVRLEEQSEGGGQ